MTVESTNTSRKIRLYVYGTFEQDKDEVAFLLLADPTWTLHTLLQYILAYYNQFYFHLQKGSLSSCNTSAVAFPFDDTTLTNLNNNYLLRIPVPSNISLPSRHNFLDLVDMTYT
jgi:hypothetical protein